MYIGGHAWCPHIAHLLSVADYNLQNTNLMLISNIMQLNFSVLKLDSVFSRPADWMHSSIKVNDVMAHGYTCASEPSII